MKVVITSILQEIERASHDADSQDVTIKYIELRPIEWSSVVQELSHARWIGKDELLDLQIGHADSFDYLGINCRKEFT